MLFADLTLRAGADGATARVHRGVLAAHSRVFREALAATSDDILPLPGKSKAELDVLVAWLYRATRACSRRREPCCVQYYCMLYLAYVLTHTLFC